jgi:hypothetical protein
MYIGPVSSRLHRYHAGVPRWPPEGSQHPVVRSRHLGGHGWRAHWAAARERKERKVLDTNHDRPFAPAPTRSGRRDEIHNEHKYNTVSHQMHAYIGIAWLIMSSRRVHRALTHSHTLSRSKDAQLALSWRTSPPTPPLLWTEHTVPGTATDTTGVSMVHHSARARRLT